MLGVHMIDQIHGHFTHKLSEPCLGQTIISSAVINALAAVFDKGPQHPGYFSGLANDKAADDRPEDIKSFSFADTLDKPRLFGQLVKNFGRKFLLEFFSNFSYFLHRTISLSCFLGCQDLLKVRYRLSLWTPTLNLYSFIKEPQGFLPFCLENHARLSDNVCTAYSRHNDNKRHIHDSFLCSHDTPQHKHARKA